MAELTYEDYKRRLSIQELLVDAGYRLNRRDGLRYPSYVRIDSDGRRVRGDKFIVTANGFCCFPVVSSHLNARTTMSSPSSRNIPIFLPNTHRGCPPTDWSTSYAAVC